tara:strand:- start:29930 stop:30073 length:144 start_codon:yes stop_codon:yes gene_type:complete
MNELFPEQLGGSFFDTITASKASFAAFTAGIYFAGTITTLLIQRIKP